MKNTWKTLVFLLSFPLLLIACGSDSKDRAPAESQQNNNLRAIYSQVEGIYRGYVELSGRSSEDFPIEIKLYIVDVPVVFLDRTSGKVETNPELKAYYRKLDGSENFAHTLRVAFNVDTGALHLSNKSISLSGNYSTGMISGESRIYHNTGTFEVHRVSESN